MIVFTIKPLRKHSLIITQKYIIKQIPSKEVVEVHFLILFCDNNTKTPYRPNSKPMFTKVTIYNGS